MGASSSVAATSPTGSKPSSTSPKTEAETCGSPRGADHTPNSVNSQSTLAKFFGAVEGERAVLQSIDAMFQDRI